MSDVFISYARSTEREAMRVVEALRSLGYSVWIDDALPAHRAYGPVIEEEMTAAKAAVVIWSADAARSEWVLSEANRAREERKLVQVRIDKVRLPMPFDTIQCADLAGWTGDADHRGWCKVAESIAALAGPAAARQASAPSSESTDAAPRNIETNNLPKRLPSLVGRERELEALEGLLAKAELVTLTGTGGVGKTRLAIEVAQCALDQFEDGVWLIELAPVTDGSQVPAAVARAMAIELHGRAGAVRGAHRSPPPSPLPAGARQLRARGRGGRRLRRGDPRGLQRHQVDRLDRKSRSASRLSGSSAFPRSPGRTLRRYSRSAPSPRMPALRPTARRGRGRRDLRSGSTASRWPSKWRPRAPRRWAARACSIGWTTASACSPAAAAPRCRASARWLRPWTGATASCQNTTPWCSAGLASSQAVSPLRPRPRSPPTRRSTHSTLPTPSPVLSPSRSSPSTLAAHRLRYRLLETTRAYALEKLDAGETQGPQRRHAAWFAGFARSAAEDYERHVSDDVFAARYFGDNDNVERALDWCFGPSGDPQFGIEIVSFGESIWACQSLYSAYLGWIERAAAQVGPTTAPTARARFLCASASARMMTVPASALEVADEAIEAMRDWAIRSSSRGP